MKKPSPRILKLDHLAQQVRNEDADALCKSFEAIKQFFGRGTAALEEGNVLIAAPNESDARDVLHALAIMAASDPRGGRLAGKILARMRFEPSQHHKPENDPLLALADGKIEVPWFHAFREPPPEPGHYIAREQGSEAPLSIDGDEPDLGLVFWTGEKWIDGATREDIAFGGEGRDDHWTLRVCMQCSNEDHAGCAIAQSAARRIQLMEIRAHEQRREHEMTRRARNERKRVCTYGSFTHYLDDGPKNRRYLP